MSYDHQTFYFSYFNLPKCQAHEATSNTFVGAHERYDQMKIHLGKGLTNCLGSRSISRTCVSVLKQYFSAFTNSMC